MDKLLTLKFISNPSFTSRTFFSPMIRYYYHSIILRNDKLQNSRARQKKYQGSKNRTNHNNSSGRSSIDLCTTPKSPSGDSIDGMIFPTSVLTRFLLLLDKFKRLKMKSHVSSTKF